MIKTYKPFFRTIFSLAAILLLANCSSKKTTPQNQDDYPQAAEGSALVLNGDSDSGKAGKLTTVYFAYDSSKLTSEGMSAMEVNAQYLNENTSIEVQIEGHADERGGIEYNLALGQKRAQGVRDFLVSKGIERRRITLVSYGKERPVVYGHDESAWSKNRRANFVVTKL